MQTKTAHERSEGEVVAWRRERLVRSGFPTRLASRLAKDGRFDLHALIDLVGQGCPPQLAVRILEPLDAHTDA